MAKKPLTQVKEWLEAEVETLADDDVVEVGVDKCRWAIGVLERIDARDSQNQKKRKVKKAKKAR